MDNYEKKYNEALERARIYRDNAKAAGEYAMVARHENIFPELAESEDERIRKKLYNTVMGTPVDDEWFQEVSKEAMLAYLEKQKEQKSNVPKPHKGDDGNPYDMCVSDAQDYAIKRGFGIPFNDGEVYVDERHMTQTIGNILRWADEHPKEQKPVQSAEEKEFIRTIKSIIADFIRDKKPEDVGFYQQIYDWLDGRHIEQKPVESISQLTVQGKGVYKICPRCKERMVRDDSMVYTSMPPQYRYECPKCGEMEFDTVMYDNPEMEEQKPAVTHGETYHVDTLGTQQVIAGKMPQKPAEWSKNDTVFLNEITDYFENKTVRLQHDLDMYAHWLKSLPERFNLQPKQEWSGEDEKNLELVTDCVYEFYPDPVMKYKLKDWLTQRFKSLRPAQDCSANCPKHIEGYISGRADAENKLLEMYGILLMPDGELRMKPRWKPSEEQMKALQNAVALTACDKELARLYNQLKKM